MTTHTLAVAYLVFVVLCLLPGSAYKHKHELSDIDWGGPMIYLNFIVTTFGVWLALTIVF